MWFLGADAVKGRLLALLQGKSTEETLAKVLEAWDSEIVDREVAGAMAKGAVWRYGSSDKSPPKV